MSSVPPVSPSLPRSEHIARYLFSTFHDKLQALEEERAPKWSNCASGDHLSSKLRTELHGIAGHLSLAFTTPHILTWQARRYDQHGPKASVGAEREEELLREFPPLNEHDELQHLNGPCTIVDEVGNILAWVLPRMLSPERQDIMLQATKHLEPILRTSTKGPEDPSDLGRLARRLFLRAGDHGVTMKPGHVNLSPGWYQRGHARWDDTPATSVSLRTPAGQQWVEAIQETNEIISAILYVIHPELYKAGKYAMAQLRTIVDYPDTVDRWSSAFNGVSVIVNRETPDHRDFNGRGDWYDILASIGTYTDLQLELKMLGVKVDYQPGTVIPILSKLLVHGVPRCAPDRVCYAWWFRDNIHRNFNTILTRWASQKDIKCGYDGREYDPEPSSSRHT